MSDKGGKVRVRLVRSRHGRLRKHRACVDGLGLRRIGHEVELEDTPAVRGMIDKISYMVRVVGEELPARGKSGQSAEGAS